MVVVELDDEEEIGPPKVVVGLAAVGVDVVAVVKSRSRLVGRQLVEARSAVLRVGLLRYRSNSMDEPLETGR